jgi:hypothetical protein
LTKLLIGLASGGARSIDYMVLTVLHSLNHDPVAVRALD